MSTPLPDDFTRPDLLTWLGTASDAELDALEVGVIGFDLDAEARVRRYNATEARGSGLNPARIIDQPLFSVVAQCMNNYIVAQRFEDALAESEPLDLTIDYVFTLRMRPTPVVLRLLFRPGLALRYVVVCRPYGIPVGKPAP